MSTITSDFSRVTGTTKSMHGVGHPPMSLWTSNSSTHFHFLSEAGIPFSRLHDTGGRYSAGVYVDIPNIFRRFDADENDPANYDFHMTDQVITHLKEQNCEPFYRLGVTIENEPEICRYRIFPPADPAKWARICEHIIRHYNEGWADGFHYGIRYWEIWNEPDSHSFDKEQSSMWYGTPEEYFRLYEVTANHLKKCFGDTIRVGGYASCGFYERAADPDIAGLGRLPATREEGFIDFFHRFLQWITSPEHKAPLEFFSWHSYADVNETVEMSHYCRRVLTKYGFGDTEDILDEWNPCIDERRFTHYAAAKVLGMMLAMQKTQTGKLNYYDASMGLMPYSGLFFGDTQKPTPTYFSMMAFNQLYRLKNEIAADSDDALIKVGGATDGKKKTLLIANLHEQATEVTLDLTAADPANAEILMISDTYTYAPTGKPIRDGKLLLPPMSCIEIRDL